MLMVIEMPRVVEEMEAGEIYHWASREGDYIAFGDTFLDVYVELDPDFKGNCPPVFHLEMTANDAGYLRKILVPKGSVAKAGAPLAVVSTEPAEKLPPADEIKKRCASFRLITQTM